MIITKTKSQLRAESEAQLKEFLRRGGVVEVDERRARIPKAKMRGKTSKGFVQGSSGFANGYPRKTGLI